MGKKRQPIYQIVATDSNSPRDGRFIEIIGSYNPKTNPATIEVNEIRSLYWLGVGAQPTQTVKNILSKEGIILRRELAKRGLTEDQITAEMDKWYANRAEKIAKIALKKEIAKKEEKKQPIKEEKLEEVTDATSEEQN
jgi:small subunit ribosomal protein S16